jgi:hypothetical protein
MGTLVIGLLFGTYINNAAFRRTVDNAVKEIIGTGVDMLNVSPPDVIDVPETED